MMDIFSQDLLLIWLIWFSGLILLFPIPFIVIKMIKDEQNEQKLKQKTHEQEIEHVEHPQAA